MDLASQKRTGGKNNFLASNYQPGLSNDSLHLLFSMATGLHEPSGEDKLDYDIYLGLQFFR